MRQQRLTTIQKSCVIVATLTVFACSSSNNPNNSTPTSVAPTSSEGGLAGVFNPNATRDVFACEAPYYLELRGSYVGRVSQTIANSSNSCTWEATLQVRGGYADPIDTAQCVMSAGYRYQVVEGPESCNDGAVDAPLIDPLVSTANRTDWENPNWPLDLPMDLVASIADGSVMPFTTADGDARRVLWRFDGRGDAIAVDNESADGVLTGTLVKR